MIMDHSRKFPAFSTSKFSDIHTHMCVSFSLAIFGRTMTTNVSDVWDEGSPTAESRFIRT